MTRLATLLLPLSLLLASPGAEAGRKARKARQKADTSTHQASDGDQGGADDSGAGPAAGEASIWDWIEAAEPQDRARADDDDDDDDGALPIDTDAVEASEELAASRYDEASLLSEAARYDSPIDFYVDPEGTLEHDPLHLKQIDPSEFDIPIVVNDAVVKWMEYFTGRGRKHYARYLGRSSKFQPMMKEKLRAAGLPEDMVYLSMIESGYNTHAYSSAAAAGLWQFISSTGKMYDLRVDFWVDQRRDPEAATDAAIRLLSDLHGQYGDWYLAWAAYNAGPGRINRAKKTYGDIDFWTMVQKNSFRPETDNYVPKLLAAAIIGKHPERYGFTGIEYQDPEAIETVEVGPSISLDVLARCAGISEEEFQHINPHLRRWALPPSPETHKIYVPSGTRIDFLAKLEQVPPDERLTFVHHSVRRGETLGTIAARYGVPMLEVQSTNRITNPNRIYPGMDLIIPRPGTTPPVALTSTAGGSAKPASTTRTSSSSSKVHTISHTVRKGETLSSIASKYGVRQSELQSWNGIRNANHVMIGQRLKVQTAAPSWTSYTVRKGDTLSTIASRYKVNTSDLQAWNDISGSRILAGQTLKIRQ